LSGSLAQRPSARPTARPGAKRNPAEAAAAATAFDRALEGSKANQKIRIINLIEIEAEAQKIIPHRRFGYISSGSRQLDAGARTWRRSNAFASIRNRSAAFQRSTCR